MLVDKEIGKAGDIDTAVITMEMKNGSIAVIDNSRKATYGYDQRAEVFGSLGAAASGNDTLHTVVLSTENGITGQKPLNFFLDRYVQAFAEELKSFVHALNNNNPVPVTGMDGLIPVLIAKAALRSLVSGKKEKVIYT